MGNKSSKITAQDRAILDLKVRQDILKKYQKKIELVADKETKIAKTALSQGNKQAALLALRKRKYQQQLLKKIDAKLFHLEVLTQSIEFALVIKEINKGISIEKVEKLMKETADAISYQKPEEKLPNVPGIRFPTVEERIQAEELEDKFSKVPGTRFPTRFRPVP
ncbi:3734_t:CDS:2 [Entrophospora sp. SA101]|nr:3734_t:CDS:2 [Entrophospora sp. SA101]